MAFLEKPIFCSVSEYKNGQPNRALEHDLQKDELYMVNLRLRGEKREAAKVPARLGEIEREAGVIAVRFSLLDSNLEPVGQAYESVSDGYMSAIQGISIRDVTNDTKYKIAQAYFMDYFDDQFGDVLEQSRGLSMSGAV